MIKSMTGFASIAREDERATVAVTIRALNHRYLDLQLRVPQSLAALESDIRALVSRHVARGRVELSISLQLRQTPGVEVEFNDDFGRALEAALEQARARGLVNGALTPGDLLRIPQAITIRDRQTSEDEVTQQAVASQAREAIDGALRDLDTMRAREGDHLRADLDQRRTLVADLVERIAVAADEGRAAMEERLRERVRELRAELQADEAAVAQEIVRMAARSDISEEVARFRAHVSHWVTLADSAEPCGRKLDFLLQEMNREVNTMGSKADGLRVSELIIAGKAELEKMREQVQNVE
ncbi:MAG: YicC family protein [Acidobacteria bacterium 13_2_20CM_2_66_4]|nr:MAG: YicC family protein [Acidobacteria bacterium 13_2_20CM_2_66_4]PYQ78406.1 MAG: YicC family protein [Acidobacteriota bacterium]